MIVSDPGQGVARGGGLPVIEVATSEGWVDAVCRFLAGRSDALEMLDALVAGRHQAWRGFVDLKPGSRVLCVGSGYGALAESLAPHCGRLVILESDADRLRFIGQRLAIFVAGADIELVTGDADKAWPFAEGTFDGVILAEPLGAQGPGRLLGEVRRVLRDEGWIFLLADNRFSFALPAGWWDRWSATPWPLPLLARGGGLLARWWRRCGGADSLPGLTRKMVAAGFTQVEALGLWPTRRQFDELIPLRNDRAPALPGEPASWRRRLRRQGFFLPAHGLTAQAGGARRLSSYARIFAAVAEELPGGAGARPLQPLRYILTRKDKMIVLARHGAQDLVIRIPFSAAAAAAEARHAAALARLETLRPGLAPRSLAAGRIDGIDYRAETSLPGRPLKQALGRGGSADLLARAAVLLDILNPAGSLQPAVLEGRTYERLVEARLQRLFSLVRDPAQQERLRDFFHRRLHGTRLPLGLVHGDFSASNIYLAGSTAGLVDWEAAAFDDLPILDAIGFLESALRPLNRRRSLAENFLALARRDLPSTAEERFLVAQYERLGIDPACHCGLVYLRWLRQIDFLVPYWLTYDADGQDRYIHQVVRMLLDDEMAV